MNIVILRMNIAVSLVCLKLSRMDNVNLSNFHTKDFSKHSKENIGKSKMAR